MSSLTTTPADDIRAFNDVRAAILSGLVAGCAYLIAQMSFSATVLRGAGWEPLQRIAALLLGPDAAPPPAEISVTIVGMALLIHFPLAGLYGRLVASSVRRAGARWTAPVGVAWGLAIYVINLGVIAPLLFPWFDVSRNVVTAFDHALFGAVAAIAYSLLRPPVAAPGR